MLQKLSIRNYTLIDSIDIEFDAGLNIITGETGAGKSIILGALALILGQRAEAKYFFNQNKKCIIEGLFKLKNEILKPLFDSNDLDFTEQTTFRREIFNDGKTRSFINDTPVNLSVLKLIGEKLIDIHSQQATLELNNREFQLLIVDVLADHTQTLTGYRTDFKFLKKLKQDLILLQEQTLEARSKQDFEQFLYNELLEAKLIPDEQAELEQELKRLNNAEQIKKTLLMATDMLINDEDSVNSTLKKANYQLNAIEKFDSKYNELNQRLKSALIEIKDVAFELEQCENKVQHNPQRLLILQERLDKLYALQQKHRVNSIEELLNKQQILADSLDRMFHTDTNLTKLNKEISDLETELLQQANKLSEGRKKGINAAEQSVSKHLNELHLPNGKIQFVHKKTDQLNTNGLDEIELLFTANAGQNPAPVNKVASGGELSRLMLAIKSVLAKQAALPTQVFDEIDAGISGETALKVGNVIADLGCDMQVIAITHLPQIAAKGKNHFLVYKTESTGKTNTGLRKLSPQERILILAEMLSGKNPGKSAIKNALELLNT